VKIAIIIIESFRLPWNVKRLWLDFSFYALLGWGCSPIPPGAYVAITIGFVSVFCRRQCMMCANQRKTSFAFKIQTWFCRVCQKELATSNSPAREVSANRPSKPYFILASTIMPRCSALLSRCAVCYLHHIDGDVLKINSFNGQQRVRAWKVSNCKEQGLSKKAVATYKHKIKSDRFVQLY